MRKIVALSVWVAAGIWLVGGAQALTITGQVVDGKAKPVQDAEVVVIERYQIGPLGLDAKVISPVVRTNAQGRFGFDVDETIDSDVMRQRYTYVVARKTGLAYGWEWLNGSLSTVARKDLPLVLRPVCPLEGQVVDADGRPVAGAEVQATPGPILAPKEWLTVTADPQGRFRFEVVASGGTAQFRVRAPGWGSLYDVRRHRVDDFGFEAGQSDIRLTLPREGDVRGRVLDAQGRPVGGVDLLIWSGRDADDVKNLYISRKTQSDRTGTFTFKGIPEGPHCIEVHASDQDPDAWVGRWTKVSVKAGEAAEAVVQVSGGGMLEVTALDTQTRRPVVGAELRASNDDWYRCRPAVTNAQGLARMRVPAGTYRVFVGGWRLFRWDSTEEVAEGQPLRFEALLRPHPRVQGRVLDAYGLPAAGAEVLIQDGDRVITDRDGRFCGNSDEGPLDKGVTLVAQDPVRGLASVRVGSPSGPVELRLGPAWTLVGKIADPNGVGIPAARVSLTLTDDKGLYACCAVVVTSPDGRFEAKAIPPVQSGLSYRASVDAAGFGPKHNTRVAPEGDAGTVVDIGTIDLPLADQTVSGIVVDANGVPAPGVFVGASSLPKDVEQPDRATVTDEKGRFRLTGKCRGPIRLQADFPSAPRGAGYISLQAPAQGVKIILGKAILGHEPKVSLQGRTLPSLAELLGEMPAPGDSDTPMLLCFVDIDQRPSRQCLSDLAKKAESLSARGVTPVILQVSKVDLRQYQDWLRANQIDMPIRVVEGDFGSKKATWGVKALPWLVLTDKEHKVEAEGFAVGELERVLGGG